MSGNRYLEIDSTYRDRNRFPLASDFEIPISQTGRKDRLSAVDPVSTASSITTWFGNNFVANTASTSSIALTVASTTGIGGTLDQFIVIVSAAAGSLQLTDGYYNNAVAIYAVPSPDQTNRIISYRYLGNDRAELIFARSFGTSLAPGDVITVYDPTDLSSTIDPYFFIPDGLLGSNSYVNCYIYNETLNQYRKQSGYNNLTNILSVDTSGSLTGTINLGPITGWASTNTYSIRRDPPSTFGTLMSDVANNPTTYSSFMIPLANSSPNMVGNFLELSRTLALTDSNGLITIAGTTSVGLDAASNSTTNFFVGDTIRMTSGPSSGQTSIITAYNGATKVATLSPGFTVATVVGNSYYITAPVRASKISKYVELVGAVTGANAGISVNLPATASDVSDEYNNLYIMMTSGAAINNIRLIQTYTVTTVGNVTTRTATPYMPFSAVVVAGDTFQITSGIVSPSFRESLSTQNFLILPFSYDNLNPFAYSGSNVSQQEVVCYDIQLLDLVLPNATLQCGQGSRITFYPYVYVELTNVSNSNAGIRNVLYANNPNATKALFRCSVDDVPNPVSTSFLKIDGDGATQTVKFKINDNLKFSVFLPNGELYKTVVHENFSPNAPNPLGQISAEFSMRRIS